ncbi:MAG: AraC family transcriptional regulator [Desulfobulbaceae bacterium]|nr:MAG: AraC family transcriptional regulator [Desulfobulbaceae bacterium]
MAELETLTQKTKKLLKNTTEGSISLHENVPLLLLKHTSPSELEATFYEPALCLILQGRKEVSTSQRRFSFGPGELLIVSHQIPVVSKVVEASEAKPYIALVLPLDMSIVRSLHHELADLPKSQDHPRSLDVNEAGAHLIDALYRLMNAARDKTDAIILMPQILREVHFRLLQADGGGMLRKLLQPSSHASKISKAISLIRLKYDQHLPVDDVAKSVGMSVSSFFHHFKAITDSTPLQYQKEIRLLEARRLLMSEGESVTLAALKVGYESPSQFSREYVRKFGSTPRSDLRAHT